jgi:Mg-chelatase subunit ChlD
MHINTPNPEPRRRHVQESPGGTQRAGFLAAVSVSVRGQVIQDTAKVSVTQLFVNDSGGRIPRASYTFPLPYGCAVSEFICHIGRNRVLRGKIKEREEAREAFEEAIGRNETVGLLDQHTTEVFTTTLGNIPQNARIKAEISFITLLNYKFEDGRGVTTFVLPTYIAPRYGNPPQNVEIERPPTTMGSFDARIDILAAEEIIAIASSSHAVSVEIGGGERIWQRWRDFAQSGGQENPKYGSARLSETAAHLNKDFVLTITTRPETGLERPQACIEQHHAFNDHRAVMLTIPERFMLQNQTRVFAAEIIFLVDRSGSMIDKIDAVKSAIEFFLRGIPEGKHFNIWSFGSEFESLWQRSTQYSARSLQAALSYVSRHFAADMGGTELLPALRAIINGGRNFQTTDIVVLTDGQVWDLVDTLDFVNHTRMATEGRVRFFSLGVGDAVSHSLVEGIAKAGGGYAEVIPSVFQMGLEPRVVAVLQAALTGHIGPVRLEIDDSNHQTAYEFQDTSQTGKCNH